MKKRRLHSDTFLVAALFLFLVFLAGLMCYYLNTLNEQPSYGRCTDEVRLCPGGGVVNRSGPQCQFSACPTNDLPNRPGISEEPFLVPTPIPGSKKSKTDPILCTQEVKACEDGSFVGKVGPNCEFAPCPDLLEFESEH